MSWLGLLSGVVAVVLTIAFIVMLFWPRHHDGSRWTIDECNEFLDKLPSEREGLVDGSNQRIFTIIVLIIALIGTALTTRDHGDIP